MSDQNDVTTEASPEVDQNRDSLITLKKQADSLNLRYHPKIGLEKLKDKIFLYLNPPEEKVKPKAVKSTNISSALRLSPAEMKSSVMSSYQEKMFVLDQQRKSANKLVRVRITNMNPFKRAHKGEIFTVSNSVVGTIKRYVPFNAQDGWHVEQMILNLMEERQYQSFYSFKDSKGREIKRSKLSNEFVIEILPPLTKNELGDLVKKQALAQNVG